MLGASALHVLVEGDWTQLIAPVGAIVGVIVGGAIVSSREGRQRKRELRSACRNLYLDIQQLQVETDGEPIEGSLWVARANTFLVTWDAQGAAVADLNFHDWAMVAALARGVRGFTELNAAPPVGVALDAMRAQIDLSLKILQRRLVRVIELPILLLRFRGLPTPTDAPSRGQQEGQGG